MSEGIKLQIDPQAIKEIAQVAADISETLRREFDIAAKNVSQQINFMGKAIRQTEADIRKHTETIRGLNQQLSVLSKQKRMNSADARTLKLELKNELEARKALLYKYSESKKYLAELNYARKEEIRQMKEAGQSMKKMEGGFDGIRKHANQLAGIFGFGFGLYGVLRLFRDATKVVAEFELAQKQLEAVTGATSREMDMFSKQAILVGSNSRFGATGVSELQVQLAKMGFSIREISNMTEAIVNLATATQEDLGKAAETVANVIRAYNMDAREATRVTDVMAKSFTSSALDMEKFRQSIKYIAPIANQANFSIEETAALLGKLADAGIYGSLAGTSLRNIISQLSDSTSALTKRVGFVVSGFDKFVEALYELNRQGVDLEDVFSIMDRRAASAFTLVLKSAGSLDEFRKALQMAGGEAERMARVQMESLTYRTQLARRAWEGFILAIDKGDGVMSRFVKDVLGGFANLMNTITYELTRQSKIVGKHITMITTLSETINDAAISEERRADALNRLKREFPEYFGAVGNAIDGNEKLAAATKKVTDELGRIREFERWVEQLYKSERALGAATESVDKQKQRLNELKLMVKDANDELGKGEWDKFGIAVGGVTAIMPALLGPLGAAVNFMRLLNKHASEFVMNFFPKRIEALGAKIEETLWTMPVENIFTFKKETVDAKVKTGVDMFNRAFKEEADKGTPPLVALESAHKGIADQINRSAEAHRARITLYGEESEEGKKAAFELRVLQEVLKAINDEYSDQEDQATETTKVTVEQLRNEQRLAELRAQKAHEGIALEERLANIRFEYAKKIAGQYGGPEQTRLEDIAVLEKEIALQQVRSRLAKEQLDIRNKEVNQIRELRNVLDQIYGEELSSEQFLASADDLAKQQEMAFKRMRESIRKTTQDIKEGRDDQVAAEVSAFNQRAEGMDKSTKEYKIVHSRHLDNLQNIHDQANARMLLAEQKFQNEMTRELIRVSDERRRVAWEEAERSLREFEHGQERQRVAFESSWRGDMERREFEKRQRREMLEEQARTMKLQQQAIMQQIVEYRKEGKAVDELQQQLRELTETRKTVIAQLMGEPFDITEWNKLRDALVGVMDDITSAIQKNLQEKENMWRRERELRDRDVQHLQRALETELQLREQGFHSNVEGKQRELAEMEKLQKRAEKQEAEAIRRRQVAEAMVQSMNILTSAAQIIRAETLKGPIGLVTAAGAIASLFAIWSGVKGRAASATKYEKGGHFILDGASHSGGGMMLARGREAQGGEGVSVWNRRATTKHWPEIRSITDAINKGKPLTPSVNVYAGSKDLSAIRKLLENSEYYENGYRVTKHGNHTVRCRLN